MRLADWVWEFESFPPAHNLLAEETSGCAWHSTPLEARPFFIATTYRRKPRKTLVVTASYERALAWEAKLRICGVPEADLYQLPSGTSALFEDAAPESTALSDRIGALEALTRGEPCIVIGAAAAILERTLPREMLVEAFFELKPGQDLDPDRLLGKLSMLGYTRQEPVRLPGQFSRRGGIVDVYVSGYDLPVRIELFGDEIESIRHFDPMSQRSVGQVPALQLSPSRETMYPIGTQSDTEAWGASVAGLILQTLDREAPMLADEASQRLEELVRADAEFLKEHAYFDRLDLYRPYLHPDSGCAMDLLGDDGWLILDEPLELESVAARAEEELAQSLDARHTRGETLHATAGDYMLPPEHLANHPSPLAMTSMNALPDWLPLPTVDVGAASLAPYRGLG